MQGYIYVLIRLDHVALERQFPYRFHSSMSAIFDCWSRSRYDVPIIPKLFEHTNPKPISKEVVANELTVETSH